MTRVVVLVIVILAMLSIVYRSWRNGISPMPATLKVRQAVAQEINRIRRSDGTIIDAGSGWGTLVFHLVRHCPGWRVKGIENSPVPLWISRFFLLCAAAVSSKNDIKSRAALTYGDIYTYPYSPDDVIVCYLYPGAMQRLSAMVHASVAPQLQIISLCFALPGWEPERIVTCGDLYRTKVYVYLCKK